MNDPDFYNNWWDDHGGVPSYLQPREHHNYALWGAVAGFILGAYMAANGLRWPRGTWIWFLWTFVAPIIFLMWLFSQGTTDGPSPEWISAAFMRCMGIAIVSFIVGAIWILLDWECQKVNNNAAYQQAVVEQQQAQQDAATAAGVAKVRYDYAVAQATGEAVAAALLRSQWRPPEDPTGAPQRPTAPKPGPTPPMGSSSSPLWVPTYIGPSKPTQRREITMGGLSINDAHGVDPDDL